MDVDCRTRAVGAPKYAGRFSEQRHSTFFFPRKKWREMRKALKTLDNMEIFESNSLAINIGTCATALATNLSKPGDKVKDKERSRISV